MPAHLALTGMGLGALISKCTKLRDEQFIAAAEAVARMVTEDDLNRGQLLPSLNMIREVRRVRTGQDGVPQWQVSHGQDAALLSSTMS